MSDDTTHLLGAFMSATTSLLGTDVDVKPAVERIADAARSSIEDCMACGVSVRDGEMLLTVAGTPQVEMIDAYQYDQGDGPCVHALTAGEVSWLPDTAIDTRWAPFSRRAAKVGVSCVLALPLVVGDKVLGALNLYGSTANGLVGRSRELAELFAPHAAVTIANLQTHRATVELANQLQQALASRSTIEQAKGILMARYDLNAEAAFELLAARSQQLNVPLREVAAEFVSATPGELNGNQ